MPVTTLIQSLASLPPEEAVVRVAPALATLTRSPHLWETQIRPLLTQPSDPAGITIVPLSEDNAAVSLALFLWSPGAETQIHDHSSWGAFRCVVGSLKEERFVRLDDGAQLNVARIRKAWQRVWTHSDRSSTLLPFSGGIHRVHNSSDEIAVSLHCYGPPGAIDGRDYEPGRDYVCDRVHEPSVTLSTGRLPGRG